MRKFLAIFMVFIIVFSVCACSGGDNDKERDCGLYITVEADDVFVVSYGTDEGSESMGNADEDEPIKAGEVVHFDIAGKNAEKKADYVLDYSVCIYDKDMEVINVASFRDNFGNMAKVEITVTEDHHIIHTGDSVSCGGNVIVDIAQTTPEDGISLAVPSVFVADNEDAETAINTAIADLNTAFLGSEKDAYKTAYDTNYAAAATGDAKSAFSMSRTVRALCGDGYMLSFRMVDRASLATESVLKIFGVSYDVETGKEIKFADLSDDYDALRSFCAERILTATVDEERFKGENMVFNEGYTETLSSLVSDGHWYFSDEGMVIIANPGEIAPVASGFFEFTIPYSELDGKLSDRWMPAEHNADYGCVSATYDLENDGLITVGQPLDDANFAITVTGNVYDVGVYTANLKNDGSYVLVSQLRYCSDMSRGGAFPINAPIGDSSTVVFIGYTTADGVRHSKTVSADPDYNRLYIQDLDGDEDGLVINSGYVCDLVSEGRSAAIEFASGKLTVTQGDEAYTLESPIVSAEKIALYDIDGDCAFEIFVSGKDASDEALTCAYKLDGTLCEFLNATGSLAGFNGHLAVLSTDFEFSGTLTLIRHYGCSYNDEGVLVSNYGEKPDTYAIADGTELTLAHDLTVDGVLSKAGTKIYPYHTDASGYIECTNSDGEYFRLLISRSADGSWSAAGTPVSDLFV